MTITGRLTADAQVSTLEDDRKVVNFCVAVNDSYKPKGGERQKVATYYNCSYWISEKLAEHLKKSTLVEVSGRVSAEAYTDKEGNAKASLRCHVDNVKILAWPKEVTVIGRPIDAPTAAAHNGDDMPF